MRGALAGRGGQRVLVTGGAGFIGSHTVDALVDRGHEVRVFDSLEPPVHQGDWPAYLQKEAERIRGSVTDRDALRRALEGVDAVFHFAAYQDYLPEFSRFFATNSAGTALLYELIVNDRLPVKKIIVASSQAVYGEGAYTCAEHGLRYPDLRATEQLVTGDWDVRCDVCGHVAEPVWTDESRVNPHNSYGMSKRDEEDIAIKLGRRYGLPSVAMRYSIVQGPRQSFRNAYSGALRSFTVRALSGAPPVMFEDGAQIRDYVAIQDVVRANLLVFEDSRADYEVFNVGGGRRVTVRELAALVLAASETPELEPLAGDTYRVGDTRHVFSDVSRLQALGWTVETPQEAIVNEYVSWAREQPDLRDTFAAAERVMRAAGVIRVAAHR